MRKRHPAEPILDRCLDGGVYTLLAWSGYTVADILPLIRWERLCDITLARTYLQTHPVAGWSDVLLLQIDRLMHISRAYSAHRMWMSPVTEDGWPDGCSIDDHDCDVFAHFAVRALFVERYWRDPSQPHVPRPLLGLLLPGYFKLIRSYFQSFDTRQATAA
jgi:hypothetical protein